MMLDWKISLTFISQILYRLIKQSVSINVLSQMIKMVLNANIIDIILEYNFKCAKNQIIKSCEMSSIP